MIRAVKLQLRFKIIGVVLAGLSLSSHLFAEDVQEDIAILKQRKADFKKEQFYRAQDLPLTYSESVDLKRILKEREIDHISKEKIRSAFSRNRKIDEGPDAAQREIIEQKMQDREDAAQSVREKKFAQMEARKERTIENAHLDINESREYDIVVPKKEDHAKARSPKNKK